MSDSKVPALLADMAERAGLEAAAYWSTIKATVMPANARNEHVYAFLTVAREYRLNPIMREIYAFPTSSGGIQPVVGIDGWLRIANGHPQFDGLETDEIRDKAGGVSAVTCRIYRKDRAHPVTATEYMSECARNTTPWKQWPIRMLTNKAIIQGIRRAFGVGGLMDQDEYERWHDAEAISAENVKAATEARIEGIKAKLAPAAADAVCDEASLYGQCQYCGFSFPVEEIVNGVCITCREAQREAQ